MIIMIAIIIILLIFLLFIGNSFYNLALNRNTDRKFIQQRGDIVSDSNITNDDESKVLLNTIKIAIIPCLKKKTD